ncbi:MAG: signal peptidase II [Hyphomicrobiaceae bacterium]
MSQSAPQSRASFLWGRYSGMGFWLVLATFLLDQGHKWWMIHIFKIGERGRVTVTPFLDLIFVINKGVSYGWLRNAGPMPLLVFAVGVSLLLWIWLSRPQTSRVLAIGLALIIGGALGNAVDRLVYGGVADFFSLHALGYYWYVFNIADVAIVAGVIGLLYDSFMPSRNDAANAE